MPWRTPTLDELRGRNRDAITAQLRSGPMVPNSVLRVMADANAGLGYLTLLYIDWLARQLMPDTSETEWLDRFGSIWVGGRKTATFATGTALVSGISGGLLPNGSLLTAASATRGEVRFQTIAQIVIGDGPTPAPIAAIEAGATGLSFGDALSGVIAFSGVSGISLGEMVDGIAEETDDELRVRVLDRIRQPPMGGDAFDYVQWALEAPGVTRAWAAPNEMGIGTVTVRFMMDDLPIDTGGFPDAGNVAVVAAHLDTKRPVAVKDFFVVAPLPEPIDFTINNLSSDDAATRAAIEQSVIEMLRAKAAPASSINGVIQEAQTIYAAWVSEAILAAPGVDHFDLVMSDHPMPSNGCMAVLGTIVYGP